MPLKVKVIIGSTRPGRFSDKVGKWIADLAKENQTLDVEVVDLREHPLPFYDEPGSPSKVAGAYPNPAVQTFAEKIADGDAFIITAAEYNHGPTAVLKNALDSIYKEWNQKPVAFVGYGSAGGARAVEQLREIAVELQMSPISKAVHIAAPWLLRDEAGELKPGALDAYLDSAKAMLEQLSWWGGAFKEARSGAWSIIDGTYQRI